MNAQPVIGRRLDDLESARDDVDLVLRGDATTNQDGLIQELHELQKEVARLNSVVFMDATGQKGIAHDVDVLMGRKSKRDETRRSFLLFWGSIMAAIITTTGVILTRWSSLPKIFSGHSISASTDMEKKPKVRRRRVIVVPPEEE